MERKGGRVFLVNHSMLHLDYEWEQARENGYVFRYYTRLETKDLDHWNGLNSAGAEMIKAKLERILVCEGSRQNRQQF